MHVGKKNPEITYTMNNYSDNQPTPLLITTTERDLVSFSSEESPYLTTSNYLSNAPKQQAQPTKFLEHYLYIYI